MTSPEPGAALRVKLDEVPMVRSACDEVLFLSTVTPIGPVSAPVGMVKLIVVLVKLAIGAGIVPPPCWLIVAWGTNPGNGLKLLPEIVTRFPTEPDLGLKSDIIGAGRLTVRVVSAD